jgi:hypothetical protein
MKFDSKKINYYFFFKNKKLLFRKIIFFSIIFFLLYKNSLKHFTIDQNNSEVFHSKSLNFKMINNFFFKLFDIKYLYSFKFNIIKIEYNFEFYENNKNLILPSDLTLYKNLHIFCHFESNNSKSIINSFPDIIENKIFKCIEYFNIFENIKYGIKIFEINENEEDINNHIIYFFSGKIFNYLNLFNKNDKAFDPLIINKKYFFNITKLYTNGFLKLQKSYAQMPKYILKKNLINNDNDWNFENLFEEYFCFCKDINLIKLKNSQRCKYYFYLNLLILYLIIYHLMTLFLYLKK